MIGALRYRTNRAGRGFTLVELLVVVLILAILMAVALPLYLNAIADSEKKTCRANMQTIANAVQAARVATRSTDYANYMGAVDVAKEKDLQAVPVCPGGGGYTIGQGSSGDNTTYKITCAVVAHGSFEPGVNSN